MAAFYLVPIPIAVPLMVFVLALIPLTPVAWVWVILTTVARGVRQRQAPGELAKAIGRGIGLTLVLPWIALLTLWAMVVLQVLTAPFVLLHHLHTLRETITWSCTQLGLTPEQPAAQPAAEKEPISESTVSSLPCYQLPPLPHTSPTAIRLLSIHPAPFNAPLRGTITTATLSTSSIWKRNPTYDAISYTRMEFNERSRPRSCSSSSSSDDELDIPMPPTLDPLLESTRFCISLETLLILDEPTQTWHTMLLEPARAAALRRVRSETEVRTVWMDYVCIRQGDVVEKARQVEMMDRIYCSALRVLVYTGEAGWDGETDRLFDWVNLLPRAALKVPDEGWEMGLLGLGQGEDEWAGLTGLVRATMVRVMGDRGREITDEMAKLWRLWGRKGREVRDLLREEYRVGMLGLPPTVPAAPPEYLQWQLKTYFARPWFKRLWPVQEVLLPGLSNAVFICGSKTTSGERMVHLASLLTEDTHSKGLNMGRVLRLFQQPVPRSSPRRSRLLDVLIATADRHYSDSRDRIYGVLNIARRLDGGLAALGPGSVDYRKWDAEVCAFYSAQFIRWHGPGFFLALIKPTAESAWRSPSFPSWAADWNHSWSWPNRRALEELGAMGRSRSSNEKDCVRDFETDGNGKMVMKIMRPRIVRGFFTRDGHIDGAKGTHIESVRQLRGDEILVEMYPSLALLLQRERGEPPRYKFVLACPHALAREGVERVVANWGKVVMYQQDIGRQEIRGSPAGGYLSLPGVYRIV
jgi:hypothetical protein